MVVGLTYLVVSGLLLQGLVNVANSAYSLKNNTTAPGVRQPATSLRSGGPGPFVTFWLVTADLPFAASAPAGHGHVYSAEFVDGWDAVLRPAGITPGELATLRGIMANDG